MARSLSAPGPSRGPHVRDLVALGQLVRNRRLALKLRIDVAAQSCGVAASVLSRLENGNPVGVDRLLSVLSGLGLALVVLTKDDALELAAAAPARS